MNSEQPRIYRVARDSSLAALKEPALRHHPDDFVGRTIVYTTGRLDRSGLCELLKHASYTCVYDLDNTDRLLVWGAESLTAKKMSSDDPLCWTLPPRSSAAEDKPNFSAFLLYRKSCPMQGPPIGHVCEIPLDLLPIEDVQQLGPHPFALKQVQSVAGQYYRDPQLTARAPLPPRASQPAPSMSRRGSFATALARLGSGPI